MPNEKTIPITLITGYLGSGKTTLINHILKNANGHRFAVVVNDIGEVNIDADLIEKSGVVSSKNDDLVPLSNGCICCTLKADLVNQLNELANACKYDHIMIEASGICEPVPIAQTIAYMENEYENRGMVKPYRLDAILSVTDALRLRDEFGCGETLEQATRGEEDLANLVIQQIEFCDIVLLNKASLLSPEELERVKMTIRALQPVATILECDYCNIDVEKLIDTGLFNFGKAANSAAWIREFDSWDNDVEVHDEDEHHHHHHHHEGVENEEEGTALEYGVGTFVYYRRRPFDFDGFESWVMHSDHHRIIRAKGLVYFGDNPSMSYIYESAGKQRNLTEQGPWYSASLTDAQIKDLLLKDKNFAHDWDEDYQDRLIKLVFIGQNLDEAQIRKELDEI